MAGAAGLAHTQLAKLAARAVGARTGAVAAHAAVDARAVSRHPLARAVFAPLASKGLVADAPSLDADAGDALAVAAAAEARVRGVEEGG